MQPPTEWHREVITPAIEEVLSRLRRFSVLSHFYLAGGTGLALRLGHRRSVDLDFFSRETVREETLLDQMHEIGGFSLVGRERGTLHGHLQGTKVSFLHYGYPALFPFHTFSDVAVADPRDIGCMKLSAIASRGARRDFVDLHAVCEHYGLPDLLELFRRKFAGVNYSLPHLLKSLTYFEDAEKEPMPEILTAVTWEQVKGYFLREAPRLL